MSYRLGDISNTALTFNREHWHDTKAWWQTGSLGLAAAVPLSESEQLFTQRQRILHASRSFQGDSAPRSSASLFHPTLHHIAPTDPHWHTQYLDIWNSVTHGNSTATKTLVTLEISYIQSSHICALITWVCRYSVMNSLLLSRDIYCVKGVSYYFHKPVITCPVAGVSCWLHRSKGPRASTPDIMCCDSSVQPTPLTRCLRDNETRRPWVEFCTQIK